MFESGKKDILRKKAYEMAYALSRVSSSINVKPFSEALVGYSVDIFNAVIREDYASAEKLILGADYFIKLGVGLGYIGGENGDIFSREMDFLRTAIKEVPPAEKSADVDIKNIFTNSAPIQPQKQKSPKEEIKEPIVFDTEISDEDLEDEMMELELSGNNLENDKKIETTKKDVFPARQETDASSTISGGIEIRQSAILDMIRQSGSCRLRDIQDLFPNASERTLRYDLEALISRELVERVGAGSATYYRAVG